MDDRFLYVSCWGTGELRQYDVSDPFNPKLTGTVRAGGIVRKAAHPKSGALGWSAPRWWRSAATAGGFYATNSLYSSWDDTFYPGLTGWMIKFNAGPDGGLELDPDFFI